MPTFRIFREFVPRVKEENAAGGDKSDYCGYYSDENYYRFSSPDGDIVNMKGV